MQYRHVILRTSHASNRVMDANEIASSILKDRLAPGGVLRLAG